MEQRTTIHGWINPISFLELDDPIAQVSPKTPPPDEILEYACQPGLGYSPEDIAARYREIAREPVRLFIAPAERHILEKLVWPLRHAKASYMFGNFLGTVALCGMVAEMVAVLLFEISDISINNQPMTESDQGRLFGRTFERLGQERRVDVLRAYGVIDDQQKGQFELIKNTRNKYLHLYSHDHANVAEDASKVYLAAATLVVALIGQDFRDGLVVLNPRLHRYLRDRGIMQVETPEGAEYRPYNSHSLARINSLTDSTVEFSSVSRTRLVTSPVLVLYSTLYFPIPGVADTLA